MPYICYNAKDMETRMELRLDKELLDAIDVARGGVPRARWLREAASAYLGSDGPKEVHRVVAPASVDTAGSIPARPTKAKLMLPTNPPTCKHSDYPANTGFGDNKTCGNCGVAWDMKESRWKT